MAVFSSNGAACAGQMFGKEEAQESLGGFVKN